MYIYLESPIIIYCILLIHFFIFKLWLNVEHTFSPEMEYLVLVRDRPKLDFVVYQVMKWLDNAIAIMECILPAA
jgi:hypothetical protein